MPEKFFQPGAKGFVARGTARRAKSPIPKTKIDKRSLLRRIYEYPEPGTLAGFGIGVGSGAAITTVAHKIQKKREDRRRELSAKLDDLIEFRAGFVDPAAIEKVFGGGMRSRLAGLAARGGSSAVARPAVMGGLHPGNFPLAQGVMGKFAAARAAANPAIAAPVGGAIRSAATGAHGVVPPNFSGARSLLSAPRPVAKPASARLAAASPAAAQQVAEQAGQAVAAGKPVGLAKYAGSLGLAGGGGLATGALLDASRRRPPEEEFLALLDGVIEFKYPASVLESSWRKWKKPSRKTFGTILRRYGGEAPQGGRLDKLGNVSPLSRPLPNIAFRFAAKDWVTKYPAEVLQSVWRKIRKPRPSSPIAPSYHSGEYHDTPKWMNKDIKKSRSENKGLSIKLDELIRFADPRPRNPLGEFSPQNSGGPDPNAMATVYKMPQQQQGGFGGTAATLLTGGALGAIGGSAGKHGYEAAVKWIKKVARKGKK